jgi:DNA-binding winged helix-turn-helix (wHTH) protein
MLKQPNSAGIWYFGPYRFDGEGQLSLGGSSIPLSPLQRRLLLSLLSHAGQVVNKDTLLQEVWGHTSVSDVNLARAMHGLRRVLGRGPLGSGVIRTVYGSGYCFDLAVSQHQPQPRFQEAEAPPVTFPTGQALSHFIEGLVQVRYRAPLALPLAAQHFRSCLEGNPGFAPAQLQLAITLMTHYRWGLSPASAIETEVEQQLAQVEAGGQMAQEIHAVRVEALSLLAWQPDQVEERYGTWLPEQLGNGAPLHSWVWHLMATGRAAQALALLDPQLKADIPCGWMLAGLAELLLDRSVAAIARLRHPLQLDQSLGGPRLLLALALAQAGQDEAALRELEQCPQLEAPTRALHSLVLALCEQRQQAGVQLEAALAAGSPDLPMASLWGLVSLTLGEESRAFQILEQAVTSRCGLAPLVLYWPGLAAYGDSTAVQTFRSRMRPFQLVQSRPAAPSPNPAPQG